MYLGLFRVDSIGNLSRPLLRLGRLRCSGDSSAGRDGPCSGVVVAEDSAGVGEDLLVEHDRGAKPPRRVVSAGEVVAGTQGHVAVEAEDGFADVQGAFEQGYRGGDLAVFA